MEAELRSSVTNDQYHELIHNLESAVGAFAFLSEHSPAMLRLLLKDMGLISTRKMSGRAESVLQRLADELRATEEQKPIETPIRSQDALRLAYSSTN